jgi:hypothetical protein
MSRPHDVLDDTAVLYDTDLRTKHNTFPNFSKTDTNTNPLLPDHELKTDYTSTYDACYKAPAKEEAINQFFATREESIKHEQEYGDHIQTCPAGLTMGVRAAVTLAPEPNTLEEVIENAKIEYDPAFSRHRLFTEQLKKRVSVSSNTPSNIVPVAPSFPKNALLSHDAKVNPVEDVSRSRLSKEST